MNKIIKQTKLNNTLPSHTHTPKIENVYRRRFFLLSEHITFLSRTVSQITQPFTYFMKPEFKSSSDTPESERERNKKTRKQPKTAAPSVPTVHRYNLLAKWSPKKT